MEVRLVIGKLLALKTLVTADSPQPAHAEAEHAHWDAETHTWCAHPQPAARAVDASVPPPKFATNFWVVASDGRPTLRAHPPRTPISAPLAAILQRTSGAGH